MKRRRRRRRLTFTAAAALCFLLLAAVKLSPGCRPAAPTADGGHGACADGADGAGGRYGGRVGTGPCERAAWSADDFSVELTLLSNGESVDSRMYPALQQMFDDMRAQGVYPTVNEGFRTPRRPAGDSGRQDRSLSCTGVFI